MSDWVQWSIKELDSFSEELNRREARLIERQAQLDKDHLFVMHQRRVLDEALTRLDETLRQAPGASSSQE